MTQRDFQNYFSFFLRSNDENLFFGEKFFGCEKKMRILNIGG